VCTAFSVGRSSVRAIAWSMHGGDEAKRGRLQAATGRNIRLRDSGKRLQRLTNLCPVCVVAVDAVLPFGLSFLRTVYTVPKGAYRTTQLKQVKLN